MSDVVHLTLINDADDSVFGESVVESSALPDSFRDDTILHIGDDDWSVVEADQITREDYEASGKLVLRLRRLEAVTAQDALYSLPTICNDLPPTEGPLLDGSELLLHGDDWRQIEFVARDQEFLVIEDLDIIEQIYRDARVENDDEEITGFQAIHLRRRLEEPLRGVRLRLDELREALPRARESRVVLESSSNCVSDSFAFFATPNLILYGQSEDDVVTVMAAAIVRHRMSTPAHTALRELASKHDLLFVDWCRCRKIGADEAGFEKGLQAQE